METNLLWDHCLPLFGCSLIFSLELMRFQKSGELRKVRGYFLLEASLTLSLGEFSFFPFSFLLRYNLYAVKCTNLKWTFWRIFAYGYPHVVIIQIKTYTFSWSWKFSVAPSQLIPTPPSNHCFDFYNLFGRPWHFVGILFSQLVK